MDTPIVSVVMSVFNGERFLAEAMDSILEQSFPDFEMIVIDDGCTDRSPAILASFEARDPRVRVFHQQNRGLIESLNRGCTLARGKYIARMDADDVAVPDRLAKQVDYMEAHPRVGLLGGSVQIIDASCRPIRISSYPLQNFELQSALLDSNVFWHPTVLFRREAFLSVGRYRHILDAEDYDLWLRIADRFDLANLEAVLLQYRVHPFQVSVRKCRQQALGAGAAKIAASRRRAGQVDPFDTIREITPTLLARLGVSENVIHTTLATGYLSCLRNLCNSGDYSLALNTWRTVQWSDVQYADNWAVSDLRLMAATIYWRQKRFANGLLIAIRAVIQRPIVLGRPVKRTAGRLLRWLTGRRTIRETPSP